MRQPSPPALACFGCDRRARGQMNDYARMSEADRSGDLAGALMDVGRLNPLGLEDAIDKALRVCAQAKQRPVALEESEGLGRPGLLHPRSGSSGDFAKVSRQNSRFTTRLDRNLQADRGVDP